jgi:hypothetical protein
MGWTAARTGRAVRLGGQAGPPHLLPSGEQALRVKGGRGRRLPTRAPVGRGWTPGGPKDDHKLVREIALGIPQTCRSTPRDLQPDVYFGPVGQSSVRMPTLTSGGRKCTRSHTPRPGTYVQRETPWVLCCIWAGARTTTSLRPRTTTRGNLCTVMWVMAHPDLAG